MLSKPGRLGIILTFLHHLYVSENLFVPSVSPAKHTDLQGRLGETPCCVFSCPVHLSTQTVLPSFPPWTREGTSAAEAPRGRQCVDEHKVIGSAPSSSSCHSPLGQLCSLSRCLGTNSCIPASTAAKRMGSPKVG